MIHCPIQAYLDFEERWKALTWKKIDLDLINKEVQSVEEVLERLREKYSKAETLEEIVKRKDQVCLDSSFRVSPPPRPYALYHHIQAKKMFAILRRLKESKLRPRHWREITHAAGVTRDKDDDFDILSIWNVDLEMFGAKVGLLRSILFLSSPRRLTA